MRRLIAPLLLLLLTPPFAHAVPVTGYALGQVTINDSNGPGSHPFAVGEQVRVTFTYDVDPGLRSPRLAVDVATPGYSWTLGHGPEHSDNIVTVSGNYLGMAVYNDVKFALLVFDGDLGNMQLSHEYNLGRTQDAFRADLVRVAALPELTAPEPSTLLMGLIGALAVGAGWRIRR
jgi:hypothetical protein